MDVSNENWYRNRRYLHFDRPVGLKKASRVVADARKVASHSFYPLVGYEVTSEKVRCDKRTGKIEKKRKLRPISYAAHMDSHIYAYHSFKLVGIYEQELANRAIGGSVLAFRSLGQSNIDFAAKVFNDISSRNECGVVALDITGFFDNLDHKILKSQLCKLLDTPRLPSEYFSIFRSVTNFSWVEKEALFERFGISMNKPKKGRNRICSPREFREIVREEGLINRNISGKGIPQGTPISAQLSNIYMLDFDQIVSEAVQEFGGSYFRYCDDMLVIVPPQWREKVADFVRTEIKKLQIDINPKKTERVWFKRKRGALVADKPLQYLGFLYDGEKTLIRSAALARFSERMKRGVKLAKATNRKVNVARSKRGLKPRKVFRRKLYTQYSHLGRRNFVTYGYRAAKTFDSQAIRKQLKPLWRRLQKEIEK